MASVFAYQSSEVDWCEDNYQHSDKVAEFYNTVSSMSFFFFAPVMMYLLHPYARERSQAVHLIWVMVMIVGIFSAYYHMTLSYVGQLLDEIAILWVLAIGYTLWFPRRHFPAFIKSRSHFAWLVFFTASVSTVMSFAKPTVNAYALNSVTLHILYVLTLEMRSCTDKRIHRLAAVTVGWWLLAISCWLSDRLLCGFWKQINFCYLHSFWHILISIAVAHGTTLFAYFDAIYEIPEAQPEVKYWPSASREIGLPYLAVKNKEKTQKCC
ncbi:alkaline ceramidase 1 isoform X1 [Latimeria chalumnae]|uniref:alkaline ceramidase 1 isoform X1 n=1 Tax=Latimeria chalumnae TaxID=7897 RepID=UPI0003C11DB3|nr:PREDICTED: alkaline ceramidase 1 isoform X1 [Latimeria chalumnae]|eukprot:XP_005989895.1 PREDICTED: alkaline ceramidase 1 isoform X1 [Latimeria chalumnae]